jgi:pimeloyl-ACP methyl ester carboxylesterase
MAPRQRRPARLALIAAIGAGLFAGVAAPQAVAKVPVKFKTIRGVAAPGTPEHLNVVGVLKTGDPKAENVLILNPGTSASAAYFEPLAKTIVKRLPDWQVWAVERRENFLEDQSMLDNLKRGRATATDLFNYYLGYLTNTSVTNHYQPVADSQVPFAREWGMSVSVNDLRRVVKAAAQRGRRVVMGGHSLGGSITTAYATWDFGGRPGGRDLSGLVLIDGASSPVPVTPEQASASLAELQSSTPWLAFGGIPAPFAGLFGMVGSAAAKDSPNTQALFEGWPLLPENLRPPGSVVPTNEAGFGFGTDAETSPPNLRAAQVHAGQLAASGHPRDWVRAGEITPIQRWAAMFSGWGVPGRDGTAWYHPRRLTIDSGAVGGGVDNPAQAVLDVRSTLGSKLSKRMRIYAFGAALGGANVLLAARALADEAGIPRRNLKLVDRAATYAHNDPNSAQPKVNAFLKRLVPFLRSIGAGKEPPGKGSAGRR